MRAGDGAGEAVPDSVRRTSGCLVYAKLKCKSHANAGSAQWQQPEPPEVRAWGRPAPHSRAQARTGIQRGFQRSV